MQNMRTHQNLDFLKNTVWFLVGGVKIPRISEMFHHLDHHSMFYVTRTTIHVEANNDPTIFSSCRTKKIPFQIDLLVGGWTNPLKNMLVKLDHFPTNRGENNKYLKFHHPAIDLWVGIETSKCEIAYTVQKKPGSCSTIRRSHQDRPIGNRWRRFVDQQKWQIPHACPPWYTCSL